MKRCLGIIFALALLSGCLGASGDTTDSSEWEMAWKCEGLSLYANVITGKVVFQGIEAITNYHIDGLAHRWDWGLDDDDSYNYSVVMDGAARYYNFRGSKDGIAKPQEVFLNCIQTK